MDATHYDYTFSTIAQTIAAAFAVWAALVILRSQWADSQVQMFSKIIADLPGMTPEEHGNHLHKLLTDEKKEAAAVILQLRSTAGPALREKDTCLQAAHVLGGDDNYSRLVDIVPFTYPAPCGSVAWCRRLIR